MTMTRYEESKIPELDHRLERMERMGWWLRNEVQDLKRTDDIIKEIRIVELAYQDKCQCGVTTINRLLEDGFEMYKQFQTESGVVVELVRWGKKD